MAKHLTDGGFVHILPLEARAKASIKIKSNNKNKSFYYNISYNYAFSALPANNLSGIAVLLITTEGDRNAQKRS